MNLPFTDGQFDAVLCQFGVMFFPDRAAGYAEARRMLRPGGRFIFNVWESVARNEFANLVTEVAAQVFPDDPPRFLPCTPYGYFDHDTIRQELAEAEFASVDIDTVEAVSRAPSPRHPAIAYCHGTPLRNEIEARGPERLEEVTDLAAAAIEKHYGSGPVAAKMQAHVVIATG